MKRKPVWILAAVVAASLASSLLWNYSTQSAGAAGRGARGRSQANTDTVENFDIRDPFSKDAAARFERRLGKMGERQRERSESFKQLMRGAKELKARSAPELDVAFCDLTHSPEVVETKSRGRRFLTPSSSQPRASVLRGFMNDNPSLFGLNSQQVAELRNVTEYTNPN